MKFFIPSLLVIFAFASLSVNAEIYKWTDANGNTHFGDHPPRVEKAERVELKINSYESVTIEPFVPFKSNRSAGSKSVVLYSTKWCGFCRKARNYMRANNIPFTEYDVEKSDKGKRDFKKLNGRAVPILIIGEKRMNGFSVSRFRQLYGG